MTFIITCSLRTAVNHISYANNQTGNNLGYVQIQLFNSQPSCIRSQINQLHSMYSIVAYVGSFHGSHMYSQINRLIIFIIFIILTCFDWNLENALLTSLTDEKIGSCRTANAFSRGAESHLSQIIARTHLHS